LDIFYLRHSLSGLISAMTNDLKDKYLPSKLFFRHKKTIFIIL
jgi:hypothetical protein